VGAKLSNTLRPRIDDAIAGYLAIRDHRRLHARPRPTNTASDEARMAHLKFTGTLAANATITIPSVSKSYWIWNATNKTLTFTTGAATRSRSRPATSSKSG
jgi:hypothetical protein